MSIAKARSILGKEAQDMTDEQVEIVIKQIKTFADVCANRILSKLETEGVKFIYSVK